MSDDDNTNVSKAIDPNLVAAVRAQIMEQMNDEKEFERQQLIDAREEERKIHAEYATKMKNSKEPWVEVLGTVNTEQGVRIELDWNPAFVEYLKTNGVTGVDEEQVIQQYITLLLRDMAEQMTDDTPEDSQFS